MAKLKVNTTEQDIGVHAILGATQKGIYFRGENGLAYYLNTELMLIVEDRMTFEDVILSCHKTGRTPLISGSKIEIEI